MATDILAELRNAVKRKGGKPGDLHESIVEHLWLSDERALRETLVERLQNIQPYIDAWSRIADVPYLEDLAQSTARLDELMSIPMGDVSDNSAVVDVPNDMLVSLEAVAPYVPSAHKKQYDEAVVQAGKKRINVKEAIHLAASICTIIMLIIQFLPNKELDALSASDQLILDSNQQVVESNERVIEAIERHAKVVEQNSEVVQQNTLAVERLTETNLQVVDAIHELLRVNVELAEAIHCEGDSPVLDEQDSGLDYHSEQ